VFNPNAAFFSDHSMCWIFPSCKFKQGAADAMNSSSDPAAGVFRTESSDTDYEYSSRNDLIGH
jgi:hypothetical protein